MQLTNIVYLIFTAIYCKISLLCYNLQNLLELSQLFDYAISLLRFAIIRIAFIMEYLKYYKYALGYFNYSS